VLAESWGTCASIPTAAFQLVQCTPSTRHDVQRTRVSHAENLRAGELGPDGWELGLSLGLGTRPVPTKQGCFEGTGMSIGILMSVLSGHRLCLPDNCKQRSTFTPVQYYV
jgi:hypothetical protein